MLSYGAFLFLYLIIPGLSARDNIDDFSFWGASFLCLIIPPPGGGGGNKDCLPAGPSFFVLNQPAAVGADKINIPRCRGRNSKGCFSLGLSFFAAICGAGTAP